MEPTATTSNLEAGPDIHHKLGQLTRQLHDALLGLAGRLHGAASELPDARSRLNYIARLTGDAAEKVLNRVDQAKSQNDHIAAQTKHMIALLAENPVAAVAKGHIMNFLTTLDKANETMDQHLTDIMMAQDFHDLTGQVIARVVALAANIENELLDLLIKTAPPEAQARLDQQTTADIEARASNPVTVETVQLSGPVVEPEKAASEVVTDQAQVDELLASLGF